MERKIPIKESIGEKEKISRSTISKASKDVIRIRKRRSRGRMGKSERILRDCVGGERPEGNPSGGEEAGREIHPFKDILGDSVIREEK